MASGQRQDLQRAAPPASFSPARDEASRVLLVYDPVVDAARILEELAQLSPPAATQRVDNEDDFLAELDEFKPEVIVAEQRPGRFGAPEVLALLQARSLDIPVLVVAAAYSDEAAMDCLGRGAEDYLAASSLARLRRSVTNARKRHQAERQPAREEIERLAEFPRSNPNPVLAFGPDGALVYFNQAALGMAQTLHKEHPREILPLNVAAVVKMCLASGQGNLRLENSLAGRTLSWAFHPIPSSQVVHCYAEDVTERIELETRLRQSQKMESVGQLAAGVAHDFNNILTIIQGHSGLLLASQNLAPALAESLRQVAQAAERAANLTRQLLMFSRKQLAQRRLMDLNEAIKDSQGMLRVLVGESIQIQTACAPTLPTIYADLGMLQQILINLAANARDAMPKGGKLKITSSTSEVTDVHAGRNPEARPGRFVCLSVADSGCGMDRATLERIFEPFFTTKDPGRGTGLGLATVYGIVKQHQGWVEVTSTPEEGTTFSIFFPAASKALEGDAVSHGDQVRGGHETIFVVEDEAALRELVLEILQQYGYRTIEAVNGVQALQIWKDCRDQIDLVLTDVMMPDGVSGRDLAEKVLADNPRMKIIYTSGYPLDVLGQDFSQKEGLVFLQKPYRPQTLARTVRDCLDS